jgi:serine/threonine protein phosphatase 1
MSKTERIVAIADIHGYAGLLETLLQKVVSEWQWDKMVFLGDYIDRGPDSKGVIELILQLRERYPGRIVCLKGNHEQWMWHAYYDPRSTSWLVGMDGLTSIRSYDAALADRFREKMRDVGPDLLLTKQGTWQLPYADFFERAMPPAHWHFFATLANYHSEPGVIFAHAGIKPGVPLEHQSLNDVCWINEDFYEHYAGPDWVIVGHMATDQLRGDGQPLPFVNKRRRIIALDTSCYRTGVLTAYLWPDGDVLATPPCQPNEAQL